MRSLAAENKKRRSWLRPGLREERGGGTGNEEGNQGRNLSPKFGPIWVADIKFGVGRLSETRTESPFTPRNYEVRSLRGLNKIEDPVSSIYNHSSLTDARKIK